MGDELHDFLNSIAGSHNPIEAINRRIIYNTWAGLFKAGVWRQKLDSPIEDILYLALVAEMATGPLRPDSVRSPPRGERCDINPGVVVLERQIDVGAWRVDLLVRVKGVDGKEKGLIVECDGHEYHERTKEQAAKDRSRDRDAQQAGYTVFRFTGSEIWRDPCKCADSIIDWIAKA